MGHTGPIADQVRQIMPVTWDALAQDGRVGATQLGGRIDYVKYRLFSTVLDISLEATTYNPLVLDYVAKMSALQIIPAGIEYWMEQQSSVGTTGTQESVSYPDRIAGLEKTYEWLTTEIFRLRPELDGIFTVRRRGSHPSVANDKDLRTPNPTDFPKQTQIGWGFDPHNTSLPFPPWVGWGLW